ncbi:hypothetical protein [Cupriavidus sp. H39]|uniref:hypothetical protein n=1 Tax=Cupriavidus sp. H39 TaxID=3401635 RepID=UPI003D02C086
MRKLTERDFVQKSQDALHACLATALKDADDESWAEQFLEAEATISTYLQAVEDGSPSLPDRQDLAYACALVLVMSQALTDLDFELIGRLYAPEVPVSMFALSKDIADMKARAVAAAEKLGGAHDMPRGPADSSTDGDVPF